MNEPSQDPARLRAIITADIGIDTPGLLLKLENIPRRIHGRRLKIGPLKAEMEMLASRYEARGQQPSQFDVERRILLSELKEEERARHRRESGTPAEGEKPKRRAETLTDGRAEDLAHASLRYRKFVEEAGEERRKIAALAQQIRVLWDEIDLLKGEREFILQKLKQAEALTFAWSAEARLTPR